MYNCLTYGCSELDDHEIVPCGRERLGGMPSVLLLECNHEISDPSNAVQVLAAIANGTATLVENVMIGIPAASPIELQPFVSNEPTYAANYDRTATLKDGNVNAQNISFYNSLLGGRKLGGAIFFENGDPDDEKVTWVDATILAVGSRIVPENNNEQQRFEVTMKWRKITEGMIYDAPAGVFN